MSIAIVILTIALLFLVIRFVQPELLYSARQALLIVRANRAFLGYGHDPLANHDLQMALEMDSRFEAPALDGNYVEQRLLKISKLYRLLDSRRGGTVRRSHGPQLCIIEAANLIAQLGRQTTPRPEYRQALVPARALLAHIANEVTRSREPISTAKEAKEASEGVGIIRDEEVRNWFLENPISVEQEVELLRAAAYGLLYRHQAETAMSEQREVGPARLERALDGASGAEPDALASIYYIQRRLRLIVSNAYQKKFGTEAKAHDRLKEVLGEQTYADVLRKMERARQDSRDLTLDFIDFIDLSHLEELMVEEWDSFKDAFPDKAWLEARLTRLAALSKTARDKGLAAKEAEETLRFCQEIQQQLVEFAPPVPMVL
jgi:hypothetical protein